MFVGLLPVNSELFGKHFLLLAVCRIYTIPSYVHVDFKTSKFVFHSTVWVDKLDWRLKLQNGALFYQNFLVAVVWDDKNLICMKYTSVFSWISTIETESSPIV
jgi:hypothetical protein